MRVSMERVYLPRRMGRLDRSNVAGLRRALRNGDVLPPVGVEMVTSRPRRYKVLDGFHRHHAHRLEGRRTIQINVVVYRAAVSDTKTPRPSDQARRVV
jgi:hypothetical protein